MITQERLKELLHYNPDTGIFTWKANKGPKIRVGDIVGYERDTGYLVIGIEGKSYIAHRLAWLYVHGYLPENEIDHINRIRNDNRLENLREVSRSCNVRNSRGSSPSKVKGVNFSHGAWHPFITVDKKLLWLGTFSSKSLAAKIRYEAEVIYGFLTCDKMSEAKEYLDNNPLTNEELREEEEYKKQAALGVRRTNTSGIAGVTWNKKNKKWRSQIKSDGKAIHLGCFETKLEAAKAIHAGELKYLLINPGETSSAKIFIAEVEL